MNTKNKIKKYSEPKKTKILAFAAGNSVTAAEQKFGVTGVTIRKWRRNLDSEIQKNTAKRIAGKKPTVGQTPKVETQIQTAIGPVKVEVTIPEHVIRAAVAQHLEQRLGIKVVQF